MTELKEVPFVVALCTYWSWTVLFLVGHVRDILAHLFWRGAHNAGGTGDDQDGYAPLRQDYEDFYTRRAYYRVVECFSRPVYGPPDRVMPVALRSTKDVLSEPKETGELRQCINLGSYNYLGFASQDEYCTPRCQETMENMGISTCAARVSGGTTSVHVELEKAIAKFLSKEDAVVIGMGYATNSTIIPVLCRKGDLIVSDALNHSSILRGVRGSGAAVKIFKHNNAAHLERVIRQAIAQGQPRTHRPWRRIWVIVEGIYSMEGEICALRQIVAVKKKYGAYLYLDEAHSIGALGATGRGACEQCGVPTADVDVLMGTFTKSFGSCGGYLASTRAVIQHLRDHSPSHGLATSMSTLAAQQTLSALRLISGADGTTRGADKIAALKRNSNYFRAHLMHAGFHVLGDWDSPVMPVMLYLPGLLRRFSHMCLERHVAVVVVGFPATPLLTARARVCISAAHTQADLDYALRVLIDVGRATGALYQRSTLRSLPPLPSDVRLSPIDAVPSKVALKV